MRSQTSTNNNSSEIYKKICMLVYFFIHYDSKCAFPDGMGIEHSRKEVQYSSAQHDTLMMDYYSFWYTTESGEKEQFMNCSNCMQNITIDGVFVKENPDKDTLTRLSQIYSTSKATFIYKLLEKIFIFNSNGLTVEQYIQQ